MRESEERARSFAKALRKQMTKAEVILWSRLHAVPGVRFRKQHPIGPYIADFACVRARVVIEVDGATHGSDEEYDYDRRRDAYMQKRGWRVVRFTNGDVYRSLDGVMNAILAHIPLPALAALAPPPPQAGEEN